MNTFCDLIENSKANGYKYYETTTVNGTPCVVVVREETETIFAYIEQDGKLIKVAQAKYTFKAKGTKLYLFVIKVEEDFRRQGIGRCVMDSLLKFSKTTDCEEIFLIAAQKVKNFYQKIGYSESGKNRNGFSILHIMTSGVTAQPTEELGFTN